MIAPETIAASGLSRRDFIAGSTAAAVATALAAAAPVGQTAPSRPQNLVIFFPDQLRAENVGCYGHPTIKTPNIDRFARESVRFAHCVCHPLCAVSRVSMFTGWPAHVRGHRSFQHLLEPGEPNLFRYLKEAGYDVFWFGKNDVLSVERFGESVTEWAFFAPGAEWDAKDNPWKFDDPLYYSFLFQAGKADRRAYPDYKRVQAGIQVLQRQSDRPFCLFLPLWFPHPPFTGPADFFNLYRPEDVPALRPPTAKKPPFYEAIRRSRRLERLTDRDFRRINAAYLGLTSYTDWLFGEFLAALEASGHAQDTNVIFSSDHGDWAGDYGLVEKWSSAMDDCLTSVPLIIRTPGGAKGQVVDAVVQLSDLLATCLELAGIEARHTHFSRSLVPQLRGAASDASSPGFIEGGYNTYEPECFENLPLKPEHIYYPKIRLQNDQPETITRATMMRTIDHKLVLRPDGMSELYDLKKDPRELENVFGHQSYAAVQARMERAMLDWYVRTSDITPRGLKDNRDLPRDNLRSIRL
jgi:arylsulfatase A-like enzyme